MGRRLRRILYTTDRKYMLSYGPTEPPPSEKTSVVFCILSSDGREYELLQEPSTEQLREIIHGLVEILCFVEYPVIP